MKTSKVNKETWKQIDWPFNTDYAEKWKGKVWEMKVGRGRIILVDGNDFMFVSSFGANSDLSYSGCFFNDPKVKTLEDAKRELEKNFLIYENN